MVIAWSAIELGDETNTANNIKNKSGVAMILEEFYRLSGSIQSVEQLITNTSNGGGKVFTKKNF